jgi:hypothetical protein
MPPAPQLLGSYTETVQSGHLLFVAGTIPTLAGKYCLALGTGLFAYSSDALPLPNTCAVLKYRDHSGAQRTQARVGAFP